MKAHKTRQQTGDTDHLVAISDMVVEEIQRQAEFGGVSAVAALTPVAVYLHVASRGVLGMTWGDISHLRELAFRIARERPGCVHPL